MVKHNNSNYQDAQKRNLERLIIAQKRILDTMTTPYNCITGEAIYPEDPVIVEKKDKVRDYIIDLQIYYHDKYGSYYAIPENH